MATQEITTTGRPQMAEPRDTEYVDTVIVGGGQAGLATAYHLARQGKEYLILEANQRVGDSWRKRWDTLRLCF